MCFSVNFTSFFTLIKSLDALPSTFYMNTLPNQHFLFIFVCLSTFFQIIISFFFTLKQIKLKMSSLHYPSYSSSSFLKRYVLQYTRLKRAKTNGKVIRDITSIRFDLEHCLVGSRAIQVLQQLFRFGAAIWTSHCRSLSMDICSPGCRISGFMAKVALLSVSRRSDVASMLTCSISLRFFFKLSRCCSAARSAERDA